MRTTYSLLCSELASNGFFVAAIEHKDGSASGNIYITVYICTLQQSLEVYEFTGG